MKIIIGILVAVSSSLAAGEGKIRLLGKPYDLANKLASGPVTTSVGAFTYLLTKEINTMRFMAMTQLGGKFGIAQETAQRLIDYHNNIDLSVMTGTEENIAELKSAILGNRDDYLSKGLNALKRIARFLNVEPSYDNEWDNSQLWAGAAEDTLKKLETLTHLSIFLERLEQLIEAHSLEVITSIKEAKSRVLSVDKIVYDHNYLLPPDTVQEAQKFSEQVHEVLPHDTSTRTANKQVFNLINDLLSTSLALLYRTGKYKVEANLIAELEPKGNLFIDPKIVLETAAMHNSSYDEEMTILLDKFRKLYSALESRPYMSVVTNKLGADVDVNLAKRVLDIHKLDQQFNEIIREWGGKFHQGQVVDEYNKLLDGYSFLFDTNRLQQLRASLDAVSYKRKRRSMHSARALYAAAVWNDHDAIENIDKNPLTFDEAFFLAMKYLDKELASKEMTLDTIKFMKKLNPTAVQEQLDSYLRRAMYPGIENKFKSYDNNKKIEILTELGANANVTLPSTQREIEVQ